MRTPVASEGHTCSYMVTTKLLQQYLGMSCGSKRHYPITVTTDHITVTGSRDAELEYISAGETHHAMRVTMGIEDYVPRRLKFWRRLVCTKSVIFVLYFSMKLDADYRKTRFALSASFFGFGWQQHPYHAKILLILNILHIYSMHFWHF